MTRISGHSSIPVKLLKQSRSAKGGVASTGFKGVKIYGQPFGTSTRRTRTIQYVVQDTSCNCGKKSFLEKFSEMLLSGTIAYGMGKFIYDIASQLFGKKKTDVTEPETPVTPQQQTVSEQTVTEDPEAENNKTYFGGTFASATINAQELSEDRKSADTGFSEDINEAVADLNKMYKDMNITVTEQEDAYLAEIKYTDIEGKMQTKTVNVKDTKDLLDNVNTLINEQKQEEENIDIYKKADKIKQMYTGIISDLTVTETEEGKYTAKITIQNTLKKAGGTAIKTVKVSSSEELDKAVSDFTEELLPTKENNPFKRKAYNNFLSEINGVSKQTNIENIDDLVKSQMALMDTDEDGYISDKEMLDYESATNKIETEERIKENVTLQFNVFDTSRDGQVSSDELKQFYQNAAGDDNILTAEEYDQAIKQGLSKLEDQMSAEILKQNDKPPVDVPQGPPPRGDKKPKTQESADRYVNAFKNGTFTDSHKIGNQYVDYKDGQFRIADNWDMENCKTISEEEVKKLYMES